MQRCRPNAGSSEDDVMCRDVLEPRMGQSWDQYVISGEMKTTTIQGHGNTESSKCDFQYFEITGTRIDMAALILRNLFWSQGC